MEILPHGRRFNDPPPKDQSFKWRLSLGARKYPVQIALTVACIILAYPIALLLGSQTALRKSQDDIKKATAQVAHSTRINAKVNKLQTQALQQSQSSRKVIIARICRGINDASKSGPVLNCRSLAKRVDCEVRAVRRPELHLQCVEP